MARSELLNGKTHFTNDDPPDRLVLLRATPGGPAATFAVWDDQEDDVHETVEQYVERRRAEGVEVTLATHL